MVMLASGNGLGGIGNGGFGGSGTMSFNSTRNATPQAQDTLAQMLRMFQQNDPNNIFLKMIGGSQHNGLPTGTQTSDPTGNDALYKMKLLGSGLLGYPQTGAFNVARPNGLLYSPQTGAPQTQTQEIKELMK